MPRAELALSRAPLHLSAVIGAATLRGRQSPPPSGYHWESPGADLALLRTRDPKGRTGRAASDCRNDHNLRLFTLKVGHLNQKYMLPKVKAKVQVE
jgi:hypothetical protein